MTRANSLADLRKHSTGDWTVVDDTRPAIAPAELDAARAAVGDMLDYSTQGARNAIDLLEANAGSLGVDVPTPTEHDEQSALFEWAALSQGEHPELAMLFAIPNGGARHPAVAAQLKAEGVKAGVPDIMLAVARGRWHGLFVELKRADRSNHATSAQRAWIEMLRRYGYSAVVAYGCAEAQQAIMSYLAQEG